MSHYITQYCPDHGEWDMDTDNVGGCPDCFDLLEGMQWLYRHEINCSVSSFWDNGFVVKIGDEMNGFVAEKIFASDELYKAGNWMCAKAREKYPEIKWIEKKQP